jgi:hypothetical protein
MSVSAPSLQFVLASYDINGTWLGLHNWTLQLQVCGGSAQEAAMWTRWVEGGGEQQQQQQKQQQQQPAGSSSRAYERMMWMILTCGLQASCPSGLFASQEPPGRTSLAVSHNHGHSSRSDVSHNR